MTARTIMELASSINDLSDFILRPWLYNYRGERLCDFGGCNGLSVMVIDGEHHCQGCLDERNAESKAEHDWNESYKEDEDKERRTLTEEENADSTI